MSDAVSEADSSTAEPRSLAVYPVRMLIFTVIVVLAIAAAFTFNSTIDDWFGQGLDVIMVSSFFAGIALLFSWVCWFLFFNRWSWSWRIIAASLTVSSPIAFFTVFRPVNSGDATILRFEPIWAARPEVAPVTLKPKASGELDLTTETPGDFPQFLGPQRNATIADRGAIDAAAFETSEALWKQPIGRGWSGFATRNGFAVTMEQREGEECVTCYRVDDGELLWCYQHTARHQDAMNLGRVGPRATPLIHKGRVYTTGAVGNFVCLDGATGEPVWQVDLNDLLGVRLKTDADGDGVTIHYEDNGALAWGRAGSALVVDDLIVIPGGGPRSGSKHTLLAFDADTGEVRWKGGTEMIAYGSPTLATVAGVRQILLTAESQAMGFDPTSGDVLWQFSRPGESDGAANTSQITIVSDNQVLTSKGYPDGGGELLELSAADGGLKATSVWRNELVLKTKMMSPVVLDGHTYALSNGFLECTRLADGKRLWKRRGRFGHGQLLLVGDQLLLHSEFGQLYLISASPDGYEELGSFATIDGVCWNTLCLHDNALLVRSELEAACYRLSIIP